MSALGNKDVFSKNLKRYMSSKNMSQQELCDKINVSYSTVADWYHGRTYPRIDKIEMLAKLFDIQKSDLIEDTKEKPNPSTHVKACPLVGRVAAGVPILAEQNIEDYFYIDKSVSCDFCLEVQGDSMTGDNIFSGDLVFIKEQAWVENGEIGVVVIEDEATLKRIYYKDGAVVLQPSNPIYDPIILTDGNVRIVGKLKAVLNRIN